MGCGITESVVAHATRYGLYACACFVAVNSFRSLEHNTRGEPDSIVALAKWRILNRLHDRNETLYYRVSP